MATAAMQHSADTGRTTRGRRWSRTQKIIRRLWRGIRDWCGDSAYERYLAATQKRHSQEPPLSEKQFYIEQLGRRYSRPNRCC